MDEKVGRAGGRRLCRLHNSSTVPQFLIKMYFSQLFASSNNFCWKYSAMYNFYWKCAAMDNKLHNLYSTEMRWTAQFELIHRQKKGLHLVQCSAPHITALGLFSLLRLRWRIVFCCCCILQFTSSQVFIWFCRKIHKQTAKRPIWRKESTQVWLAHLNRQTDRQRHTHTHKHTHTHIYTCWWCYAQI